MSDIFGKQVSEGVYRGGMLVATNNGAGSTTFFLRLLGRYWQSKPRFSQWRHFGQPPLQRDLDARQGRQALGPRRRSIPPIVYLVRKLPVVAVPGAGYAFAVGVVLLLESAGMFCDGKNRQENSSLLQLEQPVILPSQRT